MKKNRTTLKDYFKKGAIPTEANFADLIDSMLNQDEDNISKEPNAPLKILATGTEEALLTFYRTENNEQKPSWQVKQKPDGKTGLNISDTAATSRLFIENGSGNIGIGTTAPGAQLDISKAATGAMGGVLRISNAGRGANSQVALDFATYDPGVTAPSARILTTDNNNYSADIDFQTKNTGNNNSPLTTRLKITANGNVGIGGTPGAKLQVVGSQDRIALRVGAGDSSGADFTMDVTGGQGLVSLVAGAKIKSDGGGYTFLGTRGASRINLHDGVINFHTSDATGGTLDADAVGLGSGSAKMVLTNTGTVGIGTTSPKAQLEISKTLAGKLGGSLRISNPAGGSGTQAALEFKTYDPKTDTEPAEARILVTDNGNSTADIEFQTKNASARTNPLTTRLKVSADGKLTVSGALQVSSAQIQMDGNQKIVFSDSDTSNNLKLQLWTNYGLGINGSTLFYAADGNHSWRDANGTNERMLLTTGAGGGLTVKGTGDSSIAGNLGVGATAPKYKLEVAGDVSVGLKTDTPATGYGSKLYFNGASENTDPLWMARYNESNNTTRLRINLGDDPTGDQLQVGYTRDSVWNTSLSVETNGTVGIGSLQLKGFTTTDIDEWPNVSWCRDDTTKWDEGLIKASSSRGKFGRAGFGIHMHQSKQFSLFSSGWDSLFAVEGGTGNTYIKGNLQVNGTQNIIKVATYTLAIINGGKNTAGKWSVDYSSYGFSEIHTVFVVLQGYSLWNYGGKTDFAIDTDHHAKGDGAIPQHVFARVTSSDKNKASGTCYCSESSADGEVDNTVLFTVIVMGKV